MRILVFINHLGFGGTEKAACRWAGELKRRGHELSVISLGEGPRRRDLEKCDIAVEIPLSEPGPIRELIQQFQPDVIHAHAPGHPHPGDVLGDALGGIKKIPVVQTNIFGQLENPKEDAWTDFRLFISWTSCVQAAQRYFRPLDENFFRSASVSVYPVDADDGPSELDAKAFRRSHGVRDDEILLGRLSRPEPNKWSNLAIDAFRLALKANPRLKLLLREPPPHVAARLRSSPDNDRFLILPATRDATELARTISALDFVLHTSSIGESFGYGIAEAMNYGKPVIANSTPWLDQAQIELVRHGECGFIASTPRTIATAVLKLANHIDLRARLGLKAQAHIRELADPGESTNRLENALQSAAAGATNKRLGEDIAKAKSAARYLDRHQFGHSLRDQLALRPRYYWARLHQWRHVRRA